MFSRLLRSACGVAPSAGVMYGAKLAFAEEQRHATTASPTMRGSSLLIFGGSSGIGLAVAIGAAQQGASRVTLVARNPDRLANAKAAVEKAAADAGVSTSVEIHSVDVTDEEAVEGFFAGVPAASYDHLLTTPGGSARLGDLVANKRSCADVRRQLDLKFFAQLGPALHGHGCVKDNGSITLVSGVLARRLGSGNDALCVANAAIETSVKCLANDLGFGKRIVRVNCLCPGLTKTPVYDDAPAGFRDAYFAKNASAVPVQRNAEAAEMAHAIFFMMTNGFLTGAVIDVDGGYLNKP